jgi:poly-gamma-glutamate capsule biosynthesis protein CapA/YwtB (metallophosphatase superfamily)
MASQAAPLTVVAVGSAMFTRRLTAERDAAFHRLIDIVRSADAAFVNVENPIREPSSYPVKQYLYTSYVTAEPWLAEELRWAGFNLASLANNHMSDWSPESIDTNRRLLAEAGIACSGAGRTLAEARAPAYLDTRHGRVGLISVDSSYEYGHFMHVQMASDPHAGVPGRPGTNGLRWDTTYALDRDAFAALRDVYRKLGLHREGVETAHCPPFPSDDRFRFRGIEVRRADSTRKETACRASDLGEILRWVRSTRAQVDCLLVSHHNHAASGDDWELPADFAREFAHAAVDAGADAYIGHGYTAKGIELRDGRPIFYDLGDWALQDASARRHPGDSYSHWDLDPKATPGEFADARERARRYVRSEIDNPEVRQAVDDYTRAATGSVLVRFVLQDGKLAEIELYPSLLSGDQPRHRRDTPRLVSGTDAEAVLGRVVRASKPYGTTIEVREGIGRVALS